MKTVKIHPGFMTLLAQQATLSEEQDRLAQQRALGHETWAFPAYAAAVRAGEYAPPPTFSTVQRGPQRPGWGHNARRFLGLVSTTLRSGNPYNDHRFFEGRPVLRAFWAYAPADVLPIAPGRKPVCEVPGLYEHYRKVLDVCGFDKKCPILLDRDGRVLDGLHRLIAARKSSVKLYFLQLDF